MDFDLATVLTLTSAAARLRAIVDFENYHYYSFRFFLDIAMCPIEFYRVSIYFKVYILILTHNALCRMNF